ncbi:MAG: T9SS type A sorting domain-containing protein [Ferruginibacter sp.]
MKKLLYFLCLLCGVVGAKAQIVNIPDPNFKNKLILLGVDTNNDGQIQISEAQAKTSLDVSNSIINDMTGIEAFVNLTELKCHNNQLTSLNVSNNIALLDLHCYNNQLTSLNVSNNIALTTLDCHNNQLTSLNVLNNPDLQWLGCGHNQLISLDLSNNTALELIHCNDNQLTSLNLSNNTILQILNCQNNQLTSLNVLNNIALNTLWCYGNQLTSLGVSNNIALSTLRCYDNQLTSLDLSNNTALVNLWCYDNQLTSLDLSNNIGLKFLYCYSNQLTSLDVLNNTALNDLRCSNNQLASLDLSNNTALTQLDCNNNPMTTLFLKNGSPESILSLLTNCPNLTYVCADLAEIAYVQNRVPSAFVSTFCTYTPGGNYNTLSGQTSLDLDMNGCTATDPVSSFVPISINDGNNTYYTCSNQTGNYLTHLGTGNFSLSPQVSNPTYFSASTTNISFPNNNNNVLTQDFCITPNGSFADVEITFIPIIPARPGFDATYQIHYKNIGTTVANGNITLGFQGNKMNFLNASVSPASQTTNQLMWNYSNSQPFESRTINITMNILPPPTNNINDQISFDANISLANDVNLFNNSATLKQILLAAYDPNDKTCLEGKLLHNDKIGDYLHYLIRFQNTGNYPAENVVIVDSLDAAKYDLASLQIIETSHDAHIDLKSNVLQFYFENIQLADSFSNEPESHGFVVYKIKTKSTLPQNSSVSNKAEIYFDYNLPIVTNLETTTFSDFVGIADATQTPHFQYYPNPTQSTLTIETAKNAQFFMLNVMGETVKSFSVNGKENIDISNLPQGMYFLKAKGEGRGVSFIKE